MIEIKNVSFSYGDRLVLDSLSFDVRDGEFVAILGANGAGKSSLVKLISGLNSPTKGSICLNGKDISAYGAMELARLRAVLEQECSLAFDTSVLDVVLLGRFPYSKFSASLSDEKIAKSALARVDLSGFENRLYNRLSGGEKRRVQFARTLAQLGDESALKGKALLLDEPSAGLDPSHVHKTLSAAKRVAEAGASVIAVLHDPNMASIYADKILLLKDSKILDFDSPKNSITAEKLELTYGAKCKIISDGGLNFALFLNR